MTALVVHRAIGWAADGMQVTAEDWDDAPTALAALRLAVEFLDVGWPGTLDELADDLTAGLNLDLDRPYGRAILVEDAEPIRKTHQADRAGRSAGP